MRITLRVACCNFSHNESVSGLFPAGTSRQLRAAKRLPEPGPGSGKGQTVVQGIRVTQADAEKLATWDRFQRLAGVSFIARAVVLTQVSPLQS